MSDMAMFAILDVAVVLFATNRIAVEIVALGVALSLAATGVLDIDQALAGFGDRWVIFIAALLPMVVVAALAPVAEAHTVHVAAGPQRPRPNAGSRPSATRRRRPPRRHDRQLDRRPVGR